MGQGLSQVGAELIDTVAGTVSLKCLRVLKKEQMSLQISQPDYFTSAHEVVRLQNYMFYTPTANTLSNHRTVGHTA